MTVDATDTGQVTALMPAAGHTDLAIETTAAPLDFVSLPQDVLATILRAVLVGFGPDAFYLLATAHPSLTAIALTDPVVYLPGLDLVASPPYGAAEQYNDTTNAQIDDGFVFLVSAMEAVFTDRRRPAPALRFTVIPRPFPGRRLGSQPEAHISHAVAPIVTAMTALPLVHVTVDMSLLDGLDISHFSVSLAWIVAKRQTRGEMDTRATLHLVHCSPAIARDTGFLWAFSEEPEYDVPFITVCACRQFACLAPGAKGWRCIDCRTGQQQLASERRACWTCGGADKCVELLRKVCTRDEHRSPLAFSTG
ncbi:hypothetical protein H9P43_007563 [Blastocladiella emersonii ATCC 22665]|nr:hypothetical protein H9P43_007563 [Blastocladiella emersonii ATCC 22665]